MSKLFRRLLRFTYLLYGKKISALLGVKRISSVHTIYYALSTNPDFRQEVQTCIVLIVPFSLTLTVLTLDFQIRLDLL